jgi:5-methylcytosine-specific restriction endonuclease McrA
LTKWNGIARSPLSRSRKPIKRMSAKREAESKDERALYASVVAEAGRCERCEFLPAIEAHHLMRRSSGKERLERTNLVGLCRPCHQHIHDNPKYAYEAGWLRSKHER